MDNSYQYLYIVYYDNYAMASVFLSGSNYPFPWYLEALC